MIGQASMVTEKTHLSKNLEIALLVLTLVPTHRASAHQFYWMRAGRHSKLGSLDVDDMLLKDFPLSKTQARL